MPLASMGKRSFEKSIDTELAEPLLEVQEVIRNEKRPHKEDRISRVVAL
jgi:hypothetical protein